MTDKPKDKGSWLGPNDGQPNPANLPGFDPDYLFKKKLAQKINQQDKTDQINERGEGSVQETPHPELPNEAPESDT